MHSSLNIHWIMRVPTFYSSHGQSWRIITLVTSLCSLHFWKSYMWFGIFSSPTVFQSCRALRSFFHKMLHQFLLKVIWTMELTFEKVYGIVCCTCFFFFTFSLSISMEYPSYKAIGHLLTLKLLLWNINQFMII